MSKNNKFFQSPMSQNQQGYNGFDLSHSLQTTFSSGMIIPLDWHFCNPGDKFQIDEACVVKTTDLLKPSSTSGKFYVDHFFVPISVLDSFFGTKFYGLNLRESSALSLENLTNQLPCTNLSTIEELLSVNSPWPGDVFRLLDAFGVHIRFDEQGNPLFNRDRRISLYPFLAYQRVYNDYFRLTDWEAKDVASYNFDIHPSGFVNQVNSLIPLMQLRYAPLKPDYFNYYLPNPLQTSDISHGAPFAQTEDFKFLQSAMGTDFVYDPEMDGGKIKSGSTTIQNSADISSDPSNNPTIGFINTANIRNLFAVEKLLEITRRAKKTYDMQTLAHFGVNPHSDDESFRIRRSVFDLNIGQVVSSATTSEGVLGERAGLGHGQKAFSGNSKFTAKKHGIYLVVAYFLPDVVYSVDGVTEKLGTVSTNQMYHPEFDRLGMEPFNLDELVGLLGSGGEGSSAEVTPYPISGNFSDTSKGFFRLLGWRPRYSSLKIAPNVVSGGIASGRSYKEWSPQIIPDWVNMQLYPNNIKFDFGHYLDSILVVPYNPSWPEGKLNTKGNFNTVFDTDPFIFDTYLKIHKASKMSVNGLPSL